MSVRSVVKNARTYFICLYKFVEQIIPPAKFLYFVNILASHPNWPTSKIKLDLVIR